MIESMRAYGYSVPAAIADLVDNSIAANAKNLWLQFHWSGAGSWISVTDDGVGMSEEKLKDAMRLGSTSPLHVRDPKDLGRFGLGLKTASLSQCRRLTVASRRARGPNVVRRWDLNFLAENPDCGWHLLRQAHPGSEPLACVPESLQSGTVVLWECLDRVAGDTKADDQQRHQHFRATIDQVESHLAMVFHRYLTGPKARLRIFINDRPVKPWDPFLETHPATQPSPEEKVTLGGISDPVRIQGFVLPHKDRMGEGKKGEELHAHASGPAGWNAQQGFYVYRNDRIIVAGSWLGLGDGRPWTKEEHYKLARISVDIPNSMDHLWHLDVKKSSAQPPPQIRDWLTVRARRIRSDARAVFAHRGSYRQRAERRDFTRPWKAVRSNGTVTYRIDRNHPVIAAVLASTFGSTRAEVEAAFRILEEMVPVEQIWLDAAETQITPARPFHGSTSQQVRTLVETSYKAIRRNRKLSHDETVDLLLGCEEFADPEARAVIGSLPTI
jgi:hypothetical protein